MNKLHYLFLSCLILFFSACKQSELSQDLVGHWMSKSFIDSLEKYDNDPSKISHVVLNELIFDRSDSTLNLYTLGKPIKNFRYEPISSNTIRIKRFNQQEFSDFVLSKDKQTLSYTDPIKNISYSYVRILAKDVGDTLQSPMPSYSMAFLNNRFLAGHYILNDTTNVVLQSNGYIIGLTDHTSYTICIRKDCQKFSSNPLIFLSNARNEGFYFEWEHHADTLNIYNLDAARWPDKSSNFKRSSLLYQLVKK